LAKKLALDDKENSEHVMLVDLARNDLSRHGNNVKVEKYREVQFFSHVIHLVSKVTGTKHKNTTTMQVVADTFPAGTLSGAPKHKAMQLIESYEKTSRSEEHTSELQSRENLVCRLLLEKKKKKNQKHN